METYPNQYKRILSEAPEREIHTRETEKVQPFMGPGKMGGSARSLVLGKNFIFLFTLKEWKKILSENKLLLDPTFISSPIKEPPFEVKNLNLCFNSYFNIYYNKSNFYGETDKNF